MSRCASLRGRPPAPRISIDGRRLAPPSKYHDRYGGGMAAYLAAFGAANATVTRDFLPLWRSRYRVLVVRARRAVAALLLVKAEAFFAAPVAAANGLLARVGLPPLALDAAALLSLERRGADCDARALLSAPDAARLRDWLRADGDLDLEDLGPDLRGFAWPGDPY